MLSSNTHIFQWGRIEWPNLTVQSVSPHISAENWISSGLGHSIPLISWPIPIYLQVAGLNPIDFLFHSKLYIMEQTNKSGCISAPASPVIWHWKQKTSSWFTAFFSGYAHVSAPPDHTLWFGWTKFLSSVPNYLKQFQEPPKSTSLMDHAHLKLKCWAETAHCLCNNDQMHEERKQPFQHRIWIWMCRPPCPPFLGTSLVVHVPVSNTCTPLEGFCTFNETSEICRIFQRKCASFSGLTLQTTISYVYIIYVFLRICICIWLQRQVNSKNTARIMIESKLRVFSGVGGRGGSP